MTDAEKPDQYERRIYLIKSLIHEAPRYEGMEIPEDENEQKMLLRGLMNVRMPAPAGEEFLSIQDEYLSEETRKKGITDIDDLVAVRRGLYLWQGDITTLRCDAIVNAANSGMTGCYVPCHRCIDNCIHTYAGVQLRRHCADLMRMQGHEEPAGSAKITPGYNLPCRYILHTVGPIITGPLTRRDKELLASCYSSCLKMADDNSLKSVAFCCISTGEFHFPPEAAAEIAVKTAAEFLEGPTSVKKVVFNVFSDRDRQIYERILGIDK